MNRLHAVPSAPALAATALSATASPAADIGALRRRCPREAPRRARPGRDRQITWDPAPPDPGTGRRPNAKRLVDQGFLAPGVP
ncbi:hypothetical protein RND61_24205 [Streptomyces sp. TRM76323]|uniref:Uncharacterized protein n=1 Tax=Streptomyces tamarix TaxID=3078565 RepID=A0ABU3QQV3_9ACTN|nr:hypothetical protein [Streptomyces tamarix]MDT9685139.1 hypothetical protein [Streptomyces tamarix]